MDLKLKLRGKLTALSLGAGLIPLIISILYLSHSSVQVLQAQAKDYMKSKGEGYARMVEVRYASIEGNLDIIKEQLVKSLKADLIREAQKEKYYDTGYMAIFTSDGTCVYHPKPENIGNKNLYNTFEFVREVVQKKQGFMKYTFDGKQKWATFSYNKNLDWIMWSCAAEDEILAQINVVKIQMYIFLIIASILIAIAGIWVAGHIAKVANEISNRMKDIAQGDADLSVRLPVLSNDEVGDIAHWFNEFIGNLEEVIMNVKLAAIQVDSATQEVAAGSQGLSQATQEQASAIEEVAATIEEMTSSIKQNASNAEQGREKAQSMVRMASESGEASQQLVRGMGEISEASKKIGDIIVTVNEVAFQTNLLALNAAVEAARAGEHGKGFAVVAEEVRALAQRSAEAAKEIKNLIEDTVMKIGAGDTMVKKSRASLEEIITYIENLSQTMEEIAAASSEQASGVDELNRAVSQIDGTTQQNSATVEELASTSDNLSNEAKHLANVVERFKVSSMVGSDKSNKKVSSMVVSDKGDKKVKKKEKSVPSPSPVREVRSTPVPNPPSPSIENDFEEF